MAHLTLDPDCDGSDYTLEGHGAVWITAGNLSIWISRPHDPMFRNLVAIQVYKRGEEMNEPVGSFILDHD